jgi:hypothetical protein
MLYDTEKVPIDRSRVFTWNYEQGVPDKVYPGVWYRSPYADVWLGYTYKVSRPPGYYIICDFNVWCCIDLNVNPCLVDQVQRFGAEFDAAEEFLKVYLSP